jgi:gluconate 5-dehydrogenase
MSYLDALFSLNGKVALVTGSNRGIGYSLARGLGRAGTSVVLNGRDRERTEAATRDLKDEGLAAATSIADVTDCEAVIREVNRIEEQVGAIDVLANNAGIQHRAPFVDFRPRDLKRSCAQMSMRLSS